MAALRYCVDGGLLVGGKRSLSTDPCEYSNGCNQLGCSRCGARVRIGPPNLRPNYDVFDDKQHLAALYDAPDWSHLDFLQPMPADADLASRLYACKCTSWEESSSSYLVDDPKEYMPKLPWRCAGHPCPQLPLRLGEIELRDDTDWAALLARLTDGRASSVDLGQPFPLDTPSQRLIWLYHYLVGLPIAERLSAAVATRLANPALTTTVLEFFLVYPRSQGREAVSGLTRDSLLGVAGAPLSDAAVADVLTRGAAVLTADDVTIIATELGAIEQRRPGRWSQIMDALLERATEDAELEYVIPIGAMALLQSGRVPNHQLRAWATRQGSAGTAWRAALDAMVTEAQPDRRGAN